MTRQQGIQTEVSIKDLNSLRASAISAPNNKRNKNFDENTFRTSPTMESSLWNSADSLEMTGNNCQNNHNGSYNFSNSRNNGSYTFNTSKSNEKSFHWSGKSLNVDSCNSSFSDLARERSMDFSKGSFDSSATYEPNFDVSASSLDWNEGDAFPKSKKSYDTASTASSTVDISEFVVLSAFSVEESSGGNGDGDGDCNDEEYPQDNEDEEGDHNSQKMMGLTPPVPPPRADSMSRRAALQREAALKSQQDELEQAALCQHLARSGIDNSQRGRARQRKNQRGSLIRDSSVQSERCRRSISRQRERNHRSLSRQRTSRDGSHPVSRHRGSSNTTTSEHEKQKETTKEVLLLGKSYIEESDEEEDPWASCPWLDQSLSGISDVPVVRRTVVRKSSVRRKKDGSEVLDESSQSNKSAGTTKSKSDRRIQRAHSSDEPATIMTRDEREAKRRSVRETKSAGEGRMLRRTPSRRLPTRSSMKDNSHQSAPERRRASLEERLEHMKDLSARSTPEQRTVDAMMEERSRGSAKSHGERRSNGHGRVPSDVKPSRPRRIRSIKQPLSPFEE